MQIYSETLDSKIIKSNLSGRMDLSGIQNIATHFSSLLKTKSTSFLVDTTEVSFLASAGIRSLNSWAKAAVSCGGSVALYNPQPNVLEVLEACGISSLIPVYLKLQEAIDASTRR